MAQVVGDQADDRRPADAATGVPEQKRAPGHARGPGQPGRPYPQAEQEAAEEHGLGAVALEERFAGRQHLSALAFETPRPFEQPAAALATDQVADVVADDRAR